MANEVAIPARFEVEIRDLEYQRHDGAALLARLYRPIGAGTSTGPFPALIDVHGGAWASGDRLNNAPLDEALAKSGIVVLAVDFRMPPEWRYPASIADINLAIRWLKTHAQEFSSRHELVGGLGTSSGGHQLLLSALKPADPRYAALPLAERRRRMQCCLISCCAGRFRTRSRAIAWCARKGTRGSSRHMTRIGPAKPRWRRAILN
jgi:acetyl esterase/lipase